MVTKASAAVCPADSALPALNPNQPNQSSPAPVMVIGRSWGMNFSRPYPTRLPMKSAQISAESPAVQCTTVPPAKSSTPSVAIHPPSAQTQWATGS